jgi:uncharacterized protein YkwD
MMQLRALILSFLAVLAVPSVASADVVLVDPNDIREALRDKGFDWLKDKAKSGAEDWVFDTGQSETMHAILVKARERADGFGNDRNGRCQGHVMQKASDILNNVNTSWTVKTVARFEYETMTKLASMASGMTGAAAEGAALDWLVGQYVDAAKGQVQDAAMDRIKKFFFDEKKPEYELYETSGTNGDCDYKVRAVWDVANGTYRVYIAGDCHCKQVGIRLLVNPAPLGKWWISFEGHLQPNVDKDNGTITWVALQPSMDFDAECNCSKRKLRDAFQVAAAPPTPVGTVPGTAVATVTTPPFSPPAMPAPAVYAPVNIPAVPTFCSEAEKLRFLAEVVDPAQQRANDNAKAAMVSTYQLDTAISSYGDANRPVPAALTTQMNDARADLDRWQKVFDALAELHRRVLATAIIDCDRCSRAAVQPPPDRISAALLAFHNAIRARYRLPPLKWNQRLADGARQWAKVMAQTGQLQHSPPSTHLGDRESIVISRHGANSPMQMVGTWGSEERYVNQQKLVGGGKFEDVCNGEWTQCGHFIPIVWSRTTDLGCAFVEAAGFDALVCRYNPKSNIPGKPVLDPAVMNSPQQPCPEGTVPSVARIQTRNSP